MAGTIIVSSIKTDTDNSFIVRSNTGATLFSVDTTSISIPDGSITSAMIANGTVIAADILDGTITDAKIASVANTKVTGLITAGQIANVANTQITGNITSSQITSIQSSSLPVGSVLQVVTAYSDTQTTTTSTSYVSANMSTSITPSSASNKILILVNTTVQVGSGGDMQATIFRGTVSGTNLASGATSQGLFYSTATAGSSIGYTGAMMQFLDSPNTTSSTTYTVGFKTSGITAVMQKGQAYGTITLMEIKG